MVWSIKCSAGKCIKVQFRSKGMSRAHSYTTYEVALVGQGTRHQQRRALATVALHLHQRVHPRALSSPPLE